MSGSSVLLAVPSTSSNRSHSLQRWSMRRLSFRIDQAGESLPQGLLRPLVEVAFKDRVLHPFPEVLERVGETVAPAIVGNIIGDQDQHGNWKGSYSWPSMSARESSSGTGRSGNRSISGEEVVIPQYRSGQFRRNGNTQRFADLYLSQSLNTDQGNSDSAHGWELWSEGSSQSLNTDQGNSDAGPRKPLGML